MSLTILPPPPSANDITIAWLMDNKATLAAYMAAVYAGQNRQYVLTVGGVRQTPIAAQSVGGSSIVELKVS